MKRLKFAFAAALAALNLAACQDVPQRLTEPLTAAQAEPAQAGYVTGISVSCPLYLTVGELGQCSARVNYSDGTSEPVYSAGWSSSDAGVVSVSGNGLAQGVSPGTAAISAHVGSMNGSASVTVREPPRPTSVQVTPVADSVRIGDGRMFTARVFDQFGNQMSGQTVTWSVDNAAVATMQSSGLAVGAGLGTTTVRAAAGAATGTAQLKVKHRVDVSGPADAYDQYVTVTATPQPGGTYHYTWLARRCTAGGTCPEHYTPVTSGVNQTSFTEFVSRHDVYLQVAVQLRAYAGGPMLASEQHIIGGGGEPLPVNEPGSCAPRLFCD